MKCPVCKEVNLVMSDRQGVEIDYCPDCRGIWLDRGELDKIIERAGPSPAGAETDEYEGGGRGRASHGAHDRGYHKKKKKESFLGELFDF